MRSLKELYRIDPRPSSSHTLGPQRTVSLFKERYPNAYHYKVELFGSLALTGKGYLTDYTVIKVMKPREYVVLFKNRRELKHPNTMQLSAYDETDRLLEEWTTYSIGDGAIQIEGEKGREGVDVYPHHLMKDIEAYCETHFVMLWEYMNHFNPLNDYMDAILQQMMMTVDGGLARRGMFPGDLKLKRITEELKRRVDTARSITEREELLLCAYVYSASEEDASGSITVTTPTLGSSGTLPTLMCYYHRILEVPREQSRSGLEVADLLGNLVKEDAAISGTQGDCQAEIGAMAAMGAAMVSYLRGQTMRQIEYTAEIGIEHRLGLTRDPVGGYVMIPCIKRSAVGAPRVMDVAVLAEGVSDLREYRVSFDMAVNTMNCTGGKIPIELREASLGGLVRVAPLK